jgi:peptidoglycan/LPS O-acetylase OafA/YrhL
MHSLGYTMLSLCFAAVIVAAIRMRTNSVGRACLESRALLFFGKYSYGLYVIHGMLTPLLLKWTPVEAFVGQFGSVGLASIACTVTRIAVCAVLAVASWRLLEQPCLGLKRYFEYETGAKSAAAPVLVGADVRAAVEVS